MALPNNDNIGKETREVMAAQAHIWSHTFNFINSINSMSLKCAIQLGIPDIIHSHGRAMSLSDLVNALSINTSNGHDCIYRLMRILIHVGFFIQEEEGYVLAPCSRLLLKDEPLSLVPFVLMELDPNLMYPWHSLSKWLKNGGDSSTPYATTHGKPFLQYAGKEPRLNHLFNKAMASDARLVISVLLQNGNNVLFEGLKSLVDVGGSTGTVAKAIADEFPEINCIVLDLPHVTEGLEGSKNLTYIGGDMFKSIPSADAILLKWILHDWGDKDCIKILKKCKEAIPNRENGGKLIILDMVLKGDNHKSYETQLFMDMLMMVVCSGKERNEQDWGKLFSAAGFSDYNIIPILGLRSIIEVYP